MDIFVRWFHCLQINSWWQHLQVLQAEYRFIHISLRIGRPRISTKLGFYTQMMTISGILQMDKHEHERLIWRFKAQPFFVVV